MPIPNRDFARHLSIPLNRVFTATQVVPPEELHIETLSLDHDGATFGMNINGSITPEQFQMVVPEGKVFLPYRINIHMVDTGMSWGEFGGRVALTNGVIFHIHDVGGGQLFELTQGVPITTNYEFLHIGAARPELANATEDLLTVEVHFSQLTGFVPFMEAGQYFAIHIQDDLSGIEHFEATVAGRMLDA